MFKDNLKQNNKPSVSQKKYNKTHVVLIGLLVATSILTAMNMSIFNSSKISDIVSEEQQASAKRSNTKQDVSSISKTFVNLYLSQKWDALKVLSSPEYSTKLDKEIIPLFKALNSQAQLSFKLIGDSYSVEGVTEQDAVVVASLRIEKIINKTVIQNQKDMKIYLTKVGNKWLVTNMSDSLISENSNTEKENTGATTKK